MSDFRNISVFVLMASTMMAGAQSMPSDSVAAPLDSVSLGEVTVTASPVVRKADRDVYIPSDVIKGQSANGLSLLQNVQIPSLFVNQVMETITAGGNDVQLRINGREATIRDVKAINPSTVVRVEYIDNPGLRYNGATNVVNFIVRNPTLGGSLSASALAMFTGELFNGSVSAKINSGRSQWGLNAFVNGNVDLNYVENTYEEFRLSSGPVVRKKTPIDAVINNRWFYTELYYNYLVPDKTNIYVSLNPGFSPKQNTYGASLLSGTGISDVTSVSDERKRGTYPLLNVYLDHKLGRKQTLVLNLTTGWRRESTTHLYSEETEDSGELLSIDNRTKVHNFDVTAEANYIKEWNKVSLTAGTRYYNAWSNTDYYLPSVMYVKQRQQNLYTVAEATARIKSFTITAGVGGEYAYVAPGNGDADKSFQWRPRLSVSYRLNDMSRFNLSLMSWSNNPSLTEMSDVVTDIDGIQQSVGNPMLKSYTNFNTRFSYVFAMQRVSVQCDAAWFRSPHSIDSYYYLSDDDHIVSSYANQGYSRMEFAISPRVDVIPQWLTVSGRVSFRRYFTHGPGYRNQLSSWSGSYEAVLSHWGFSLIAQGHFSPTRIDGQDTRRGERISIMGLSYRWKNLNATMGMFVPYGHYSQGSGVMSPVLTRNTTLTMPDVERRMFVQLSYNFQWGAQKRQGRRLIDAPQQDAPKGGVL